MGTDDLVDEIVAAHRAVAAAQARELTLVAAFTHRRPGLPGSAERDARFEGVSEFAAAELAAALTLTRRGADLLLDRALGLERLPATMAALAAGRIDLPKARVIAGGTAALTDADARAVEDRVLPRAAGQTSSLLGRAVARAVLAIAPETVQEQGEAAHADRRTELSHFGDGRSRYAVESSTEDILRIATGLDALARTLDPATGTVDQRRVDALVELVDRALDDPTLPATRFGPPGLVLITDADPTSPTSHDATSPTSAQGTAHGAKEHDGAQHGGAAVCEPVAELLGAGPIAWSDAARLAADPHCRVVPATPPPPDRCAHDVAVGYAVPDRIARGVLLRDRTCRFPGCRIPAHRCDLDHTIPYPSGPTCACNLACLCRYHHRLKTHGGWQLTQPRPGHLIWTSPTGHTYRVHPDHQDDDQPD
jgi:hypothetical protein